MLRKFVEFLTTCIFTLIGIALLILSLGMVATAFSSVALNALEGKFQIYGLLNSVSSIVISAAVLDLGKFILEEEVVRGRDLGAVEEVRASLTKFMTIILIAMSLEALVMVFEVSTSNDFSQIVYPSLLMATTIFAMIAIGLFQWLTRRSEEPQSERQE